MIGIIGAMEEEVRSLQECMTQKSEENYCSMKFCRGKLYGKSVVVVMSGIGKVNMAVCAQILLGRYNVDVLINTGIAGSLDPEINIGDIVVGTDAVEHDMDASSLGDPVGQVPRMDVMAFPCSERLADLAVEANKRVNPDIRAFKGRVLSGDQFISDSAKKDYLVENFKGLCCEMEGAAMAHTAYLNGVECLILRAISDKADGSAHMDYGEFSKMAIEHTMRLILEMIPEI